MNRKEKDQRRNSSAFWPPSCRFIGTKRQAVTYNGSRGRNIGFFSGALETKAPWAVQEPFLVGKTKDYSREANQRREKQTQKEKAERRERFQLWRSAKIQLFDSECENNQANRLVKRVNTSSPRNTSRLRAFENESVSSTSSKRSNLEMLSNKENRRTKELMELSKRWESEDFEERKGKKDKMGLGNDSICEADDEKETIGSPKGKKE